MVNSKYQDNGDGVRFWNGTPEEEQAYLNDPIHVQIKLEQLWQAADTYVHSAISGYAESTLAAVITFATATGQQARYPKCFAVDAWIQNIWLNHYYPQKALVTRDYSDYDFSVCGPIPFSVPELTIEVQG